MINNNDPYISAIKTKINNDDEEEITMKDLGTYMIVLNKEYDAEMKRHVTLLYSTSSFEFNDGIY